VSTLEAVEATTPRRRVRRRASSSPGSDFVVGRNYRRRESALGLSLTVPAFVFFCVFVFYPFLRIFYLALFIDPPYPGLPAKYVGIHQFTTAVTSSAFYDSLKSTAIFAAIIVPLGVGLGLFLALIAHQKLRGMSFYRTAFASTITSSLAVSAAVFNIFLTNEYGFLPWVHIHIIPQVLENSTWALPAMALIQVWQFTGFAFIILIAGLQSLPDEVLEAAEVDGASPWSRLRHVTLPLLSTSIYLTLIVAVIGALQGFGQIDSLIGPASSAGVHTNVLVYLIYQATGYHSNPGLAACYSIVLFAITLVVTLIQLRIRQRRGANVF
jgi:ABC-type sugar transport system permease subunit